MGLHTVWVPWLLITLDRFYGLGLRFSFLQQLQLVCLVGMGKWGLYSLSVCRMQVCSFAAGHVGALLSSEFWLIMLCFSAVLIGALNDRLLLATPTEINPRQKKGVEIKSCLVGLLEPLLIGFATMQERFEQKLDLPETLYQITSRFLTFYHLHNLCKCYHLLEFAL